jgi:hypothetical protein
MVRDTLLSIKFRISADWCRTLRYLRARHYYHTHAGWTRGYRPIRTQRGRSRPDYER